MLAPKMVLCASSALGLDTFTFSFALGPAMQCRNAVSYARAIGDSLLLFGIGAASMCLSRKVMNNLAHALNGNMLSPLHSMHFQRRIATIKEIVAQR